MSRAALVLLLAVSCAQAPRRDRTVEHGLTIVPPGDPESRPFKVTLEQRLDADGNPVEYRMWVDSVICREKVCDVVKVRLTWDALGRYRRYEVRPGEKLTKKDHVPFTAEDRQKLHRILLDKESPLKEVTKEGLTGEAAEAGVDGVAGPTVLTLSANVVLGAGYTCYDLWHWANGEVSGIVRRMSGATCSAPALARYLHGHDEEAIRFALTQLHRRKIFDPETTAAVTEAARTGPAAVLEPALDYLHDTRGYADAVAAVFASGPGAKRVRVLQHLAKSGKDATAGLLDRLSGSLPACEDYREVHLFLSLVEKRGAGSPTVIGNVLPLLDHARFFVARRAFWFLDKQPLSAEGRKKVDAFKAKNADRL